MPIAGLAAELPAPPPGRPLVVGVDGRSAGGKSTVSDRLAAVTGAAVVHTDDVAWYVRERFESLGLPIWFMPYVNLQRPGVPCDSDTAFCGISGVIQPGDVLHTDVGICSLKLCTDTQEMGYVLRMGETEVPEGLRRALAQGKHNGAQD